MQEFVEPGVQAPALAIVGMTRCARMHSALCGQREQAFAQRRRRGQLRLLLDEGDAKAIATLEIAIVELQRTRDHLQQRGFARAVAADQSDALARLQREARTV